MARIAPATGVEPSPKPYPGVDVSVRKARAFKQRREMAVHRVKNGVYDTYTYYHLVEELANLTPWRAFTSAQLANWLNGTRPALIWDAVTVGRILNDLIESWNESNPGDENQPLRSKRTWAGMTYELTDYEPARVALMNLVEDLCRDVDELHELERRGEIRQRLTSPLSRCPSLVA